MELGGTQWSSMVLRVSRQSLVELDITGGIRWSWDELDSNSTELGGDRYSSAVSEDLSEARKCFVKFKGARRS